jgi:hypothetical protein
LACRLVAPIWILLRRANDLARRRDQRPVAALWSAPELQVDSARWANGSRATTFKAKDDDDLWFACRSPGCGDSATLHVFYHGNLIDRFENWFFINPSADWYPNNRQGDAAAAFDIIYHSPNWYPIASVGRQTDSVVDGKVMTTRWVDPAHPVRDFQSRSVRDVSRQVRRRAVLGCDVVRGGAPVVAPGGS